MDDFSLNLVSRSRVLHLISDEGLFNLHSKLIYGYF